MHQRHWCPILAPGPQEPESAADPEGLRVVCRAVAECDEGDCGACDACCGRRCLRRIYGGCARRHPEPDGFLRLSKETSGRRELVYAHAAL